MTLNEFNTYMNKQFDKLIETLCPKNNNIKINNKK